MEITAHNAPFRLTGVLDKIPGKALSRSIESVLERVFSLKHLDRLYQSLPKSSCEREFLKHVFETLNIRYQISPDELQRIPKTGPLVVVANHPFGAIEGIILAAILREVRPDVKIMANFLLKRIPELSDLFISVDPFGTEHSAQRNIKPLKESIRWLKQGGVLVVFPAGEVAHKKPGKREAYDPVWSPTIGRLIRLAQAPVQSVYFSGSNSPLFQWAGLVHPKLRTALLPRELINKTNTTIPVKLSHSLSYNKIKNIGDDKSVTEYLRLRTYALANSNRPSGSHLHAENSDVDLSNIISPVSCDSMVREIARLSDDNYLVDAGDLKVYCAYAKQIPNILQEIGRLREISFRYAGEGSGKSVDLDFYDQYYLHLFIWNQATQEVVGAYRLGQGDKILDRQGLVGFYSYSLFKFSKRFVDQLNPALELGRSFVRREYQKSFSPLMLLWRGIGEYVVRNPHYRMLFGPVSISSEYQTLSQRLLVDFLLANNNSPGLAKLVKPRQPFRAEGVRSTQIHKNLSDPDAVSNIISDIEKDHKGMPILIKQYLKLGGEILAFNVDPQFNNTLDGLIVVDLMNTDPKTLSRYFGKDGVEIFRDFHKSISKREAA